MRLKGFTLIELLVVLGIIGILVTIASFGLQGARESARDSRRKSDLELIRSGLEIYRADCNRYPAAGTGNGQLSFGRRLNGNTPPSSCASQNTYISEVPEDPLSSGSNQTYSYNRITSTTYALCASLEVPPASLPDISNCASCGNGFTCNYVASGP